MIVAIDENIQFCCSCWLQAMQRIFYINFSFANYWWWPWLAGFALPIWAPTISSLITAKYVPMIAMLKWLEYCACNHPGVKFKSHIGRYSPLTFIPYEFIKKAMYHLPCTIVLLLGNCSIPWLVERRIFCFRCLYLYTRYIAVPTVTVLQILYWHYTIHMLQILIATQWVVLCLCLCKSIFFWNWIVDREMGPWHWYGIPL